MPTIDLTSLADAGQLRTETDMLDTAVGVAAATTPLRPDLNGYRLKHPAHPTIYLVDNGHRRSIPDPATYNNLFRDWNGIVQDPLILDVPEGLPIVTGSVLAKASGTASIYLVEPGSKRGIASPHTMDAYYFSWNRVYTVPPVLIASIPTGPTISA